MSLLLFYGGSENPSLRRGNRGALASTLNHAPLYAMRYNTARDTMIENMGEVGGLGIRWALPGGVQRFEFTIKAKSAQDAYDRYKRNLDATNNGHHGDGVAVADRFIDYPIVDGWVYEVRINGLEVTYICASTWERCNEQYQASDPSLSTIDTADYLQETLTAAVPASSTDYSNIQDSGVQMGSTFAVNTNGGDRPQDIIKTLIKMGTSTAGELLDFYFISAPFDGILPQLPVPVLKPRSAAVQGWNISKNDISSLQIGSHIWRLKNDVTIYYPSTSTNGTNAASQSAYWERQHVEEQSKFDATQAAAWRDTLLEYDSQPQQQVSFTIDAPIIRYNRGGGRWHISRMMVFAESIIIRDLFPASIQFDTTVNGNTGFRPVTLDYDHTSQKIRVTPDNKDGDQRLDVILQQLGASVGQSIGV